MVDDRGADLATAPNPLVEVRVACFDWGGTLMSEDGPVDLAMGLWPRVQVIADAAACLAALDGVLPLAIATNASVSTRPLIEKALARVDFARYFQEIFCYTELGVRKDQPAFWQIVAQHFGVAPRHLAMVGDSYAQDAAYPRHFGVQGVWFNPTGARADALGAVPQVRTLSQFATWVRAARR